MYAGLSRPPSRPGSANSKTLGPPSASMPPGLNVKSVQPLIATNSNTLGGLNNSLANSNNSSSMPAVSALNGSLPKTGPLNHPIPASVVEKEYIHNLQQQVYFLEMQGKLLRERLSTPGPRVKSRSVEANPATDRNLDAAAPLSEHIDHLRQKYADQEAAFRESKKELQQQYDTLKSRYAELEEENKNLKEKCSSIPDQIKDARRVVSEENIRVNNECEKLRQQLSDAKLIIDDKDSEIDGTNKTIKGLRESISLMDQEKKTLEHQLREAQRGFCSPQRAQAREIELGKALTDADSLRKELQRAQERLHDIETREIAAQDSKWKTEKQITELQSQLREVTRANEGLRTEISNGNNTITTLRRESDQKNLQIQTLKATVESLQEELRLVNNDAASVNVVTRKLNDAESAMNQALSESEEKTKEISLLKGEKDDLFRKVDDLNAVIDGLRDQQSIIGEQLALAMSQKKNAEIKERDTDRRSIDLAMKLSAREKELMKAKAEIDVLTAELGVFGEFSSMKEYFDEITRLRSTNEKLGETIKKLTEKFICLRKASKAYADIGGDDLVEYSANAASQFSKQHDEISSPNVSSFSKIQTSVFNNNNKGIAVSNNNTNGNNNITTGSKNTSDIRASPSFGSQDSEIGGTARQNFKNSSMNYSENDNNSAFKNTVVQQTNFKLN